MQRRSEIIVSSPCCGWYTGISSLLPKFDGASADTVLECIPEVSQSPACRASADDPTTLAPSDPDPKNASAAHTFGGFERPGGSPSADPNQGAGLKPLLEEVQGLAREMKYLKCSLTA